MGGGGWEENRNASVKYLFAREKESHRFINGQPRVAIKRRKEGARLFWEPQGNQTSFLVPKHTTKETSIKDWRFACAVGSESRGPISRLAGTSALFEVCKGRACCRRLNAFLARSKEGMPTSKRRECHRVWSQGVYHRLNKSARQVL